MNKLLLGIAAGLINATQQTVHGVLKKLLKNPILDKVPDGQIDLIKAVTLSDILGIDVVEAVRKYDLEIWRTFGVKGIWNSTDMSGSTNSIPIPCTTIYRLYGNASYTTTAEIRGGLDGYSIGKKIHLVLSKNPRISLSQIIRMYYSQKGSLF